MTSILVIGANGFIGRRVLEFFCCKSEYIVTGLSLHSDFMTGKNYNFIKANICDSVVMEQVFRKTAPDIVINCSAISATDYCESHKEEAYNCNSKSVELISLLCNNYNSRFIHLSTDFVFNGLTDKLYKENDLPGPVNYYGMTKFLAEQFVANICTNYAILRVVVVYGKPYFGQHNNFLNFVHQKLSASEQIITVNDQWRTPTYIGDVVKGIELLSSFNGNGIYHICGDECLTISEIAFRVSGFLGLVKTLIRPVSSEEMHEKTPRPKFSGLSIDKAKSELGYSPISLEEGMKLLLY